MKLCWWLFPVLSLCVSGCVKEKIDLSVNPDGSGTITMDVSMTAQTIAMTKQMTADFAGSTGNSNAAPDAAGAFFKEDEMRERAKEFGPGVEFVKVTPTTPNGGEGCIATYQFADISQVRLPMKDNKNGGEGDRSKNVTFTFTKGPTSKLVVHVPQQEETAKTKTEEKAEPGPEAAMMESMMEMFKGMEVSLAVKVKGAVVSSTASHPQGQDKEGALLMAVNFDELRTNKDFAKIFASSQGEDLPAAKLNGMKGFTYETKDRIEIQFK